MRADLLVALLNRPRCGHVDADLRVTRPALNPHAVHVRATGLEHHAVNCKRGRLLLRRHPAEPPSDGSSAAQMPSHRARFTG
eukprot:6018854-Prymnesium_polylepis.1